METQTVIGSPQPAVHPLKCFAPCDNFEGEVGDVIEIDRTLYSHWAVYIGDGKVIHVCGQNTKNTANSEAQIVEDTLQNVAGASLVRVNNKEVPALQRNLTALHPKLVVENAKQCLQQKVTHNVMSVMAEQFVTACKYGSGWSDQANTIASVLKKRTRPVRTRNKSGNTKKEHTVLRKTTGDRRDNVQKNVLFTENAKEPRKMTDPTNLAPLVKGLADIFKRKVPGNRFASMQGQ